MGPEPSMKRSVHTPAIQVLKAISGPPLLQDFQQVFRSGEKLCSSTPIFNGLHSSKTSNKTSFPILGMLVQIFNGLYEQMSFSIIMFHISVHALFFKNNLPRGEI